MKIIIILFSIIYCLFTNLAVAEKKYLTTYYEFSGNFTTTLNNTNTSLQITIGLSTQYDEEVMNNVARHNLELRKIILQEMEKFSPESLYGKAGKEKLADKIKKSINYYLENKEGFGGIGGVHFTSFMMDKSKAPTTTANKNKNLPIKKSDLINDIIDMISIGIFTGIAWVGLNFIRLIIADTLFTKKLTLENKKKYISKRKNGHLTAFVFGIGVYLLANSGVLVNQVFQTNYAVFVTKPLISILIALMVYQHISFNSKLKKEINSSTTNDNSDVTSHLDSKEVLEEDIDESTLDETQKLEKVESMYKKKLISSTERKKMRNKILGID